MRLYQGNNSRLVVQDGKGRTAAHQAAARNRVNIMQFIREQHGSKFTTHITVRFQYIDSNILIRKYYLQNCTSIHK